MFSNGLSKRFGIKRLCFFFRDILCRRMQNIKVTGATTVQLAQVGTVLEVAEVEVKRWQDCSGKRYWLGNLETTWLSRLILCRLQFCCCFLKSTYPHHTRPQITIEARMTNKLGRSERVHWGA